MKTPWFAAVLTSLTLVLPASAQTPVNVFSDDVTEAALIEVLTPEPPVDPPLRTRSFTVEPDDAAPPPGPATPAKPASASLLITFETNSAALTARAKHVLDVLGEALLSDRLGAFRFAIQGHADPRGKPESNLTLSQLRAESVRDYLVQYKHIDDRRLEAVGKGSTELLNTANPIAPENRRVTVVNLGH